MLKALHQISKSGRESCNFGELGQENVWIEHKKRSVQCKGLHQVLSSGSAGADSVVPTALLGTQSLSSVHSPRAKERSLHS
eukprot:5050751-Amphidinium_carterae.1